MASPTAPVITSTGISAPTYAQVYSYLQAQYYAIFGSDALITPDTQDGQLLAVFAQAISDANSAVIAAYLSFSPATGQGVGLSNNVQINGLQRLVPTASTAAVVISGIPNTVITNGQAIDPSNNQWNLPASVTIGPIGTLSTTVTCAVLGAISLGVNTLTINTPTFGWTGITNSVGLPGNPSETDAALRVRQAASVSLPSVTIFEGIVAQIEDVPGVTRVKGYENNTSSGQALTGGATLPANNLLFVVEGATAVPANIFNAIFEKITPGIPTWAGAANNNQTTITDSFGSTRLLNYATAVGTGCGFVITLHALAGWSTTTETLIANALAAYLVTLPIGGNISYFGLIPVMQLIGTPQFGTFEIISYTLDGTTADLVFNYNWAPIMGTINFSLV